MSICKVSVIMPVYNTESELNNTLKSVLDQTLQDIEVICVDDCSTDGSLRILNEWAAKNGRVKVVHFEKNQGVATARNTALDMVQGEYIAFLDSDDAYDPAFLEKLYEIAQQENADIVKGGVKVLQNGVELDDFKGLNDKIRENKYNFNCNFWSAIYRKTLIEDNHIRFSTELSWGEDRIFQLKALFAANRFKVVDTPKYLYIKRAGSLTMQNITQKRVLQTMVSLNLLISIMNEKNLAFEDYKLLFDEFFIMLVEILKDRKEEIVHLWDLLDVFSKDLRYKNEILPGFDEAILSKDINKVCTYLQMYKTKLLLSKIRSKKLG